MDDLQEIDKRRSQLTLGGLFLWLTCVLLMLGLYLQLFDWMRARSNEIRLQQSYIYFSSTQGAWVSGSSLFAAIYVALGFLGGRFKVTEPGIVLLLALFAVQLPSLVWGTIEAWHIDPNDPLAQSIDIQFLQWGVRGAHLVQVALFAWACYYFRTSTVWLVIFGLLGLRLALSFLGLYPYVLTQYPISYQSFYEPIHVWSPLVLVVIGAFTDLFRHERFSWLHFLGIVTWVISFLSTIVMTLGIKFP